jgi:outer membrane receptor protein involved in Fe transport
VQDQIRLKNWTINAGLRWDHYQLILNRHAVDPRFAISRYFPSADLVVHFSYDRVFQTPSFENILLSSSPAAEAIDPSPGSNVLRLVEPSEGNYYEAGLTKAFARKGQAGRQLFSATGVKLCRRRSDREHDHQFSDRLPEGRHLRCAKQRSNFPTGAAFQAL